MRKPIVVGKGFGKHAYSEALDLVNSGDGIALAPGLYRGNSIAIRDGFTITFRGLGENPADVILEESFYLGNNTNLIIENMTLRTMGNNNIINATNASSIELRNVILESPSNIDTEFPVIYVGAFSTAKLSSIETHIETNRDGIQLVGGKAEVSQSILTNTSVINGAEINIESSLLNNSIRTPFFLSDNANAVLDNVYVNSTNPKVWDMIVLDGSVLEANSTHFQIHSPIIKVNHGFANVHDSITDDGSLVEVLYDEQSTIVGENLIRTDENPAPETSASQEPMSDSVNVEEVKDDVRVEQSELQNQDSDAPSALSQLHHMIGLKSVKDTVDNFINRARVNKARIEQGLPGIETSMNSLFLGNRGTGKTTVAKLMGQVLYEEGVLKTNKLIEVTRKDLVGMHIGETALLTQEKLKEATNGILFVDEAYTLYSDSSNDAGKEAVETIMAYMENHRDDLMVIFAGYDHEMENFLSMNQGLESRVPNRFIFEDYSPDEISEIGLTSLKDKGFVLNVEKYQETIKKAYKNAVEKSNGRWARNFNDKLIGIQGDRLASEGKFDRESIITISDEDLNAFTGGSAEKKSNEVENILSELNNLTGLSNVKEFVQELVQTVKADRKLAELDPEGTNKPTYHMVFSGAPGTGKTTVARLIARLFYNLGILENDRVVETNRSELVGQYIGETEKNTKQTIKQAMGGVLFVDEAYQLTAVGGNNDFGKQAVETMITELEEHRNDFIAIFAGYTDDMHKFLDANAGLQSRIPKEIEFLPYTSDEIAEMVDNQLTRQKISWQFNHEFLKNSVKKIYENLPKDKQSNGRWARNYVDKLQSIQKSRIVEEDLSGEDMVIIPNEAIFQLEMNELNN